MLFEISEEDGVDFSCELWLKEVKLSILRMINLASVLEKILGLLESTINPGNTSNTDNGMLQW